MPIPEFVIQLRRRIGNDLLHLPGVAAIVFDDAGRVLLGQRADSGRWSVVGGIVEPGEEPAGTVLREVPEETGVCCEIDRISGVYTTPVITYPNGNQARYVVTAFACRATGGTPRVADDESLDVRFFPPDGLPADLSPMHRKRIDDARGGPAAVFEPPAGPIVAGVGGMSPFIRQLRAKVGNDRLPLIGVSAVVFDDSDRVLLVHARETGSWMPVGGMVEPGEEPAQSAAREVLEEAGALVTVDHLVGVYDGPAVVYGNGDRAHYTTIAFRCRVAGGVLKPDGNETSDVRFFPADQLPPLRADHRRNIDHALARRAEAFFVRDRP